MTFGSKRMTQEQLGVACKEYLDMLCETTSKVLDARKELDERIHVNIKAIAQNGANAPLEYEVLARSANPDSERVRDDDRSPSRRLKDNAFYDEILRSGGETDYCLVGNIEDYINSLRTTKCVVPDPRSTPKLFKSCLICAVKGPKSPLLNSLIPDNRASEAFGLESTLLGFICVDTKIYDAFDDQWDLRIMREMASKAFNAFQLYYSANSAVRAPQLRPVS